MISLSSSLVLSLTTRGRTKGILGTSSTKYESCVNSYSGRGNCSDGALQLMGGVTVSEGRVEICMDGVFGTVCDNNWDNSDAIVVCRQLGFAPQGELRNTCINTSDFRYELVFNSCLKCCSLDRCNGCSECRIWSRKWSHFPPWYWLHWVWVWTSQLQQWWHISSLYP